MIRLLRAKNGASLVEYSILVGLISVLAIGGVLQLGQQTETSFKAPTATLSWYVNGVTEDYAARYRFTAAQNPTDPDRIGVDGGALSGSSYGSFDEATFEDFDLRSLQYDASADTLEVILAGNTVSRTPGHRMRCVDLALGEAALTVDFDTVMGIYVGFATSTLYTISTSSDPFLVDQELACVIEAKS